MKKLEEVRRRRSSSCKKFFISSNCRRLIIARIVGRKYWWFISILRQFFSLPYLFANSGVDDRTFGRPNLQTEDCNRIFVLCENSVTESNFSRGKKG